MGLPRRPGQAHRHVRSQNSQPFTEIARAALRELQASAATLGAQAGVGA